MVLAAWDLSGNFAHLGNVPTIAIANGAVDSVSITIDQDDCRIAISSANVANPYTDSPHIVYQLGAAGTYIISFPNDSRIIPTVGMGDQPIIDFPWDGAVPLRLTAGQTLTMEFDGTSDPVAARIELLSAATTVVAGQATAGLVGLGRR